MPGKEQRGTSAVSPVELAARYSGLEAVWRRRTRHLTQGRVAAFLAAVARFYSPQWLSHA